jgi:hypothetical protein
MAAAIGTSCLALVLQCLEPLGEIPAAARLNRQWYAAACLPATWRSSIRYDIDAKLQPTPRGLHVNFKDSTQLVAAASSKIYCNLASLACPRTLTEAECAGFLKFHRISTLVLGGVAPGSGWEGKVDLQMHLNVPSLRHLQYLSITPHEGRVFHDIHFPDTLQHLHIDWGLKLEQVKGLAVELAERVRDIQTIYIADPECAIELSTQLLTLDFPVDSPLQILPNALYFSWSPTLGMPAHWIRRVFMPEWYGRPDVWRKVVARFPDVCSLDIEVLMNDWREFSDMTASASEPWATDSDQTSRLHTLRFPVSEDNTFDVGRLASDWLRGAGSVFSGLHTLDVPALGTHAVGWADEFQRMPLLTDLTMTDLPLTPEMCADFSHLPLLRRLRGVCWPIDHLLAEPSDPLLDVAPRAGNFPSLLSLGLRSGVLVYELDNPIRVVRPCGRISDSLFPHGDLLRFLQSLPRKLEQLEVHLLHEDDSEDDQHLTKVLDFAGLQEYLTCQALRDAEKDAAYLSHLSTRGTSAIPFLPAPIICAPLLHAERTSLPWWQSIGAMPCYEERSLEELRLEDIAVMEEAGVNAAAGGD